MGITGLLPFLEKASSACHLRDLRGKCVAIDTYCWLHRGAFGCAERIARGEPTDMHIQYCLKYVQLLLTHNIKPILVFDGQHLPAKAATEAKRRENRETARKRGAELLRLGRIEEARSFLRRCVDITHEMALQLIRECRKRGVDCIVAPYEADAQLAYLNRTDIAQYVITEDSDLVLFGCNRILFKLDLTGNGRLVDASKLHLAMGCREDRYKFTKFRYMCILSGCDYLDSLPGIGLGKACKFMMKTEDPDIRRALAKIPAYLNMRQLTVTEEYKDEFLKADATFKHMVVYDPVHRRQTRLEDPDDEGTPEQYCCNAGKFMDEKIAFQLAIGNLDPFSLRKMDDWHPDGEDPSVAMSKMRHPSIWRKDYTTLKEVKAAQSVTKSQTTVSSLSTFVKRTQQHHAEHVTVEQETKETITDILQIYGIQSDEPPSKRLCHVQTSGSSTSAKVSIDYQDLEALDVLQQLEQPTTPKRSRNPFAVTPNISVASCDSADTLLSPTKITPETRSLLRNISPVKRIDYSQQRSQQATMTTTTTTAGNVASTSRLSRFKTAHGKGITIAKDEPKVISRFFCTQAKLQSHATVSSNSVTTKTPDGSPKRGVKSDVDIIVSPTAIVKEIKSRRNSQSLKATALYLSSPDSRLPTRGDRTPEKVRSESRKAYDALELGRFDSGIAMGENSSNEGEGSLEGDGMTGLSSSQKENDEVVPNATEKQRLESKPPSSSTVRLALFERQPTKGLTQSSEHSTQELATVLLDDDSSDEDTGKQTNKTEPLKASSLPSSTSGVETIVKSKARTSCKRPGLSIKRKQPDSKTDNTLGLTQTRLSMFGFQKKPTFGNL
uniref:Exonuclease 1 n=1 Tax=Anopheles epiroticus TaxID=199890 RepID=A0A182PP82_9DIPT